MYVFVIKTNQGFEAFLDIEECQKANEARGIIRLPAACPYNGDSKQVYIVGKLEEESPVVKFIRDTLEECKELLGAKYNYKCELVKLQ